MKKHRLTLSLLPLVLAIAIGCIATLARAADPDPQQAAITAVANAFVEAFHKADARALAAFWTPDGDYVSVDGDVIKGRQEIEQDFAELFAEHKDLKLRIEVANIKFPSPDTAIEDGVTSVMASDGTVISRAAYTNIFMKQNGQWLLASVRERPFSPPSNYQQLRGLEWTIGEWVDETPDGHVGHILFQWSPDQNFILTSRGVEVNGAILDNGSQRIGWDAAAKQIRSWSFESDGGFGEGTWTKDGDKWIIKTASVLASGAKMTATNVVTRVDADTITWQGVNQQLNGKPLPDSPIIKMNKVK